MVLSGRSLAAGGTWTSAPRDAWWDRRRSPAGRGGLGRWGGRGRGRAEQGAITSQEEGGAKGSVPSRLPTGAPRYTWGAANGLGVKRGREGAALGGGGVTGRAGSLRRDPPPPGRSGEGPVVGRPANSEVCSSGEASAAGAGAGWTDGAPRQTGREEKRARSRTLTRAAVRRAATSGPEAGHQVLSGRELGYGRVLGPVRLGGRNGAWSAPARGLAAGGLRGRPVARAVSGGGLARSSTPGSGEVRKRMWGGYPGRGHQGWSGKESHLAQPKRREQRGRSAGPRTARVAGEPPARIRSTDVMGRDRRKSAAEAAGRLSQGGVCSDSQSTADLPGRRSQGAARGVLWGPRCRLARIGRLRSPRNQRAGQAGAGGRRRGLTARGDRVRIEAGQGRPPEVAIELVARRRGVGPRGGERREVRRGNRGAMGQAVGPLGMGATPAGQAAPRVAEGDCGEAERSDANAEQGEYYREEVSAGERPAQVGPSGAGERGDAETLEAGW